jgi:GT2 family glycosyltransferase
MRKRLDFVEASRFWKLAQLWFRFKQRLGLALNLDVPQAPATEYFEATALAEPYSYWLAENVTRQSDLQRLRGLVDLLPARPTFGLIVANADAGQIFRIVDSLQQQVYDDWNLILRSSAVIPGNGSGDPRITKATTSASDTVAFLNEAVAATTCDFIVVVDPNALLAPDALFEVALAISKDPALDIIYSDHDVMATDGARSNPYFKPDWSPETLLSRMYLGPLVFYRRSLLAGIGGFRSGFDAAVHFDVALRATETTDHVGHVSRILYHVRPDDPSPASSAEVDAQAVRAIGDALDRRSESGLVSRLEDVAGCYIVRYPLDAHPRVSIILPTRDNGKDLSTCLTSIFERTTYPDFHVLVGDNGSKEPAALSTMEYWSHRENERLTVERLDMPFNFSKINNTAAKLTDGEFLLFLNDDTEVLTADWIEALVEQARRPAIGAAGGKLLYHDGSVQHAGVILGIRGIAGHAHRFSPGNARGYHGALQAVTNYSAVTAACMMMRRTVFDEVGGFDEDLAIEFNDIDLCLRVRAAGYRIVYLPHVLLYHAESRSRGRSDNALKLTVRVREQRLMQERWNMSNYVDPNYNPNLTLEGDDFSPRL